MRRCFLACSERPAGPPDLKPFHRQHAGARRNVAPPAQAARRRWRRHRWHRRHRRRLWASRRRWQGAYDRRRAIEPAGRCQPDGHRIGDACTAAAARPLARRLRARCERHTGRPNILPRTRSASHTSADSRPSPAAPATPPNTTLPQLTAAHRHHPLPLRAQPGWRCESTAGGRAACCSRARCSSSIPSTRRRSPRLRYCTATVP